MIQGTIAKIACEFCGLRFYPGNMDRHRRSCMRTADERRRIDFMRRMARRAASR